MGYVDISPAVEFMEKLEKRKHGNACHNCGDLGRKSSECDKPKMFKGTCCKCKEEGHRVQDCAKINCSKCKGEGHCVDECTGPETRSCRNFNEVGHIKEQCPGPRYRALKFTLPHEASKDMASAKAAVDDDADEPDTVPPPALVPGPWTKLQFKDPKIDPKQLSRYLDSTALEGGDILEDPDNYALGETDAQIDEFIADSAATTGLDESLVGPEGDLDPDEEHDKDPEDEEKSRWKAENLTRDSLSSTRMSEDKQKSGMAYLLFRTSFNISGHEINFSRCRHQV